QTGPRPVWFVLDELASLQRLPQLHTAVTENRKSNNPVVLGFQGRSQLEDRKSTRLNSSHGSISYAVFCLKKKKKIVATPSNRYKGNVNILYFWKRVFFGTEKKQQDTHRTLENSYHHLYYVRVTLTRRRHN